jgi:hypothetical protein
MHESFDLEGSRFSVACLGRLGDSADNLKLKLPATKKKNAEFDDDRPNTTVPCENPKFNNTLSMT